MPKGVRIEQTERGLEIRYRRFRGVAVFLLLCGLGALGFLLTHLHGEPVALLLSVVLSVALTYWSAVHVFGTCVLRVQGGTIRVRQRPLPWWPRRDLPVDEVRGFEVKITSSRNQSGGSTPTYHLHALTSTGHSPKLVGGVEHRDQVHAMERALVSALGGATAGGRARRTGS